MCIIRERDSRSQINQGKKCSIVISAKLLWSSLDEINPISKRKLGDGVIFNGQMENMNNTLFFFKKSMSFLNVGDHSPSKVLFLYGHCIAIFYWENTGGFSRFLLHSFVFGVDIHLN